MVRRATLKRKRKRRRSKKGRSRGMKKFGRFMGTLGKNTLGMGAIGGSGALLGGAALGAGLPVLPATLLGNALGKTTIDAISRGIKNRKLRRKKRGNGQKRRPPVRRLRRV